MAKLKDDYIVDGNFPHVNPPICNLWTYLEESCVKYSSKTALEDKTDDVSLTFIEVHRRVEAIAANLLLHDFNPKRPLCICMINSIEYLLVAFAVWRLGGSVTLITPLLTSGEIKRQIALTEPEFVVCDNTTAGKVLQILPEVNIKKVISKHAQDHCILLSTFYTAAKDGVLNLPSPNSNPIDVTGLIPFSSGTTGDPKAVNIHHGAFVKQSYYFSCASDMLKHENNGVVYQPLAHVYGLLIMLNYFTSGKKVIIMSKFNLEEYIALISKEKIPKLFVTPPIVVLFCKSSLAQKYDVSHITDIISSGAPVSTVLEEELGMIIGGNIRITQVHGMTETGVNMSPYDTTITYPKGTVGWPIGKGSAKVIDIKTGVNLGPNKNGEICLKNDCFMAGYWGNEEATRYIISDDGWLRTGDLGYYDEQLCFFFVDRLKELIKYQFYQIAPSELESWLLTHPAIADAAVTSIPSPEFGELPVAWVVLKPEMQVSEDELHTFVNENVAPFKRIRGGIQFVEQIPKSNSGKILRRVIRDQVRSTMKL